ncbi:MAG: hypothetical protein RRA94_11750 [Bacteroidota bacterium]|nr:hypothetical protein [Bacteroidota bacterium]
MMNINRIRWFVVLFVLGAVQVATAVPEALPFSAGQHRIARLAEVVERPMARLELQQVQSDSLRLTLAGEGNRFLLRWIAPPQFSCLSYRVERAWSEQYAITADVRWIEVGDVPGICYLDQSVPYSFKDESSISLSGGSVQYRLYVKTLEGEEYYAYTETVLVSAPERIEVVDVFPQPAVRQLSVSITAPSASSMDVRLFNGVGQTVYSGRYDIPAAGLHTMSLEFSPLPPGVYLMELSTAAFSDTRVIRLVR